MTTATTHHHHQQHHHRRHRLQVVRVLSAVMMHGDCLLLATDHLSGPVQQSFKDVFLHHKLELLQVSI